MNFFYKYFCIFSLFFVPMVLTGCLYSDEPMPVISRSYVVEEGVGFSYETESVTPAKSRSYNAHGSWIPRAGIEKKWTAIVIHHTASVSGNASIIDRWHREGRNWDGIGYDFVIGNGSKSGDGEVEITYRWYEQRIGAHCGGTAGNWANREGIGICLVGNFNDTSATPRQLKSLGKLLFFLQGRYQIPRHRIFGHGTVPGAIVTDCPGRRFSMSRVKGNLY